MLKRTIGCCALLALTWPCTAQDTIEILLVEKDSALPDDVARILESDIGGILEDIFADMFQGDFSGTFQLAGVEYHVTVCQWMTDGWGHSDLEEIVLTAAPDEGYTDKQPFPNVISFGGDRLYTLSAKLSEPILLLTPYTGPTGLLRITTDVQRLTLNQLNRRILLYRPGREVRVPVGEYRLNQYQLEKAADDGTRWYLCALGRAETPIVTIDESRPGTLEIGGPFTPKVRVSSYADRHFFRPWRTTYWLDYSLVGRSKEDAGEVSPIGQDSAKPTRFVIRNAKGRPVKKGAFEYG